MNIKKKAAILSIVVLDVLIVYLYCEHEKKKILRSNKNRFM